MKAMEMNRRSVLRIGASGAGLLALGAAGCRPTGQMQVAEASSTMGTVIVDDVIDHVLTTDAWPGAFGFVTFRTHDALHDGNPVRYIRTDASDPDFAEREGLVHVPLLNSARGRGINNDLFVFDDGSPSVIRYAPGSERFTPLFEIKRVAGQTAYDSADAIDRARDEGRIEVEGTGILVNYPLVQWPGGALTVDDAKEEYLGGGQLIEDIGTHRDQVTLKLHEAFPGSYYILTDASLGGPAGNMNVPVSAPTWQLNDYRATDRIWVFANGVEGSGAMGFQPGIFGNQAGHPAWSPFWDHYTLEWRNESEARLLTSADEARELRDADVLREYNGVPPTHPQGFVVNCPVPVIGENKTSA